MPGRKQSRSFKAQQPRQRTTVTITDTGMHFTLCQVLCEALSARDLILACRLPMRWMVSLSPFHKGRKRACKLTRVIWLTSSRTQIHSFLLPKLWDTSQGKECGTCSSRTQILVDWTQYIYFLPCHNPKSVLLIPYGNSRTQPPYILQLCPSLAPDGSGRKRKSRECVGRTL